MKVAVTGANGMVGRAVTQHCILMGDDVTPLSHNELNIADKDRVLDVITSAGFDGVINCAAFTDVDACETDRETNYDVNAYGVEHLALACRSAGANLVTISTDYVFSGSKDGFYTQRDDPDPQSQYARAKLEGERLARAALARTTIVRSGWIFGAGGTNFLSTVVDRMLRGEGVTAISDMYGTPTYANDLARRLHELANIDLPGTYHITNTGDGTSYADFARTVLAQTQQGSVRNVSASDLTRPAPRPLNSRLKCLLSESIGLEPLRPWEAALAEFIEERRGS